MNGISRRYRVIVIGVGGMGSATVFHLARRGIQVLGLEQFDIPHNMGSSHGIPRAIRMAYFEHPSYVLLLRRAYELWRELERHVGEQLLHIYGGVDAGPPDSGVFLGSLQSCIDHDLAHEVLTSTELTRRFPGYRLPADTMAVFQPQGGMLTSERCIVAYVMAAQKLGAEVHGRERVLEWEPLGDGVRVTTMRGTYEADRLIITSGAWSEHLLDVLNGLAVPERQVLAWFQPSRPELFTPERFPFFNIQIEGERFYGFPVFSGPGVKVGKYHHLEEVVDPDTMDRDPSANDERVVRACVERYFPDAVGPIMRLAVCLFTNSPDRHFIIDQHPDYPQVMFAASGSGHGFKFSSVIGEILADLAERGMSRHNIELFRLKRLLGRRQLNDGQSLTRAARALFPVAQTSGQQRISRAPATKGGSLTNDRRFSTIASEARDAIRPFW